MKKIHFGAVALFLVAGMINPGVGRAALNYGSGVYTNLCGTGTQATAYKCSAACDPAAGTCTATSDGAVRYVCTGNWNQCLENESGWGNGVSLGNPGCGSTVQLSVYDRKCRKEDGSWDFACRLLGYMVWYSGSCRAELSASPTPVPSSGSKFSSPTPVTTAVATSATPIPDKPKSICNKSCNSNTDCGLGFSCLDKICRNKDCPTDKSCFCSLAASSGEVKAIATNSSDLESPQTGISLWIWTLVGLILGFVGFKAVRIGKMFWS